MNSIWIYLLASVKCFQNTKYYIGHPSSLNFTSPILSLPALPCTLLSVVGYSEIWGFKSLGSQAWPNAVFMCCSCWSRSAFGPPTLCEPPTIIWQSRRKFCFETYCYHNKSKWILWRYKTLWLLLKMFTFPSMKFWELLPTSHLQSLRLSDHANYHT